MKQTHRFLGVMGGLCLLLPSCKEPEPTISGDILDGNTLQVENLYQKEKYLLSYKIPKPTDKEKPVIILSHGFSATVFEWDEFREWIAEKHPDEILTSQVLLKGHGRNYNAFKKSTWKQWQESITEEYQKLWDLGYRNISLAGSSTSGSLIIDLMRTHYFDRFGTPPKNIFLIDPLVIPSNRFLSLIKYLGRFIGYTDSGSDDDHPLVKKHWYRYYPQAALKQLEDVASTVKEGLEDGIQAPNNTYIKVYKSTKDPTVAPVSAVLIYKGLQTHSGSTIDVEMIDSDLHVYTRLKARKSVSQKDQGHQTRTFEAFYEKMK